MILSMSNQAVIFLTAALVGAFVGFVYDLFRVLRKTFRHPNLVTYLEDAVYWLFVTLVMFYVMLNKNYGEIRAFSVAGVFLGMLLYFLSLSRLFMKVSMTLINWIKKLLLFLFRLIMAPFQLIAKLMKRPLRFCQKKLAKMASNIKRGLHKTQNYAKMKKKKVVNDIRIITKKV